jgi:hypothetical protein
VRSRKIAGLSAGVALEPGHLHIEFQGTEDLLSKLYELSQAAANEFEKFDAPSARGRVVAPRVDSCEVRRAVRQPSASRYAATSGAATVARSGSPPNKAAWKAG